LFRDLELNGPARLFLNNGCPVAHAGATTNVINSQPDEITGSQFAVERGVE
jgi:hypothetical protein